MDKSKSLANTLQDTRKINEIVKILRSSFQKDTRVHMKLQNIGPPLLLANAIPGKKKDEKHPKYY